MRSRRNQRLELQDPMDTATEKKNAAAGTLEAAAGAAEKSPAVKVELLRVAKNWRCKNPALVVCEDAEGTQCLVRVKADTRENFRPCLASGEPMMVRATRLVGNLYVIEGAGPRWPGRWRA